ARWCDHLRRGLLGIVERGLDARPDRRDHLATLRVNAEGLEGLGAVLLRVLHRIGDDLVLDLDRTFAAHHFWLTSAAAPLSPFTMIFCNCSFSVSVSCAPASRNSLSSHADSNAAPPMLGGSSTPSPGACSDTAKNTRVRRRNRCALGISKARGWWSWCPP